MYTVIDAEKKFMKADADNNGVCPFVLLPYVLTFSDTFCSIILQFIDRGYNLKFYFWLDRLSNRYWLLILDVYHGQWVNNAKQATQVACIPESMRLGFVNNDFICLIVQL